jgi:hypothetical protein
MIDQGYNDDLKLLNAFRTRYRITIQREADWPNLTECGGRNQPEIRAMTLTLITTCEYPDELMK